MQTCQVIWRAKHKACMADVYACILVRRREMTSQTSRKTVACKVCAGVRLHVGCVSCNACHAATCAAAAAAAGWLLVLITSGAVACSVLFERRLWCRYLCPIGMYASKQPVCAHSALLFPRQVESHAAEE
jgi:hypothetical protein